MRTTGFTLLRYCYAAGIILLMCAHACIADSLKVVIPPFEKAAESHIGYFYDVLKLALKKTEASDGPFEISFASETSSVNRSLADLKNDVNINVMWTTIDKRREQELLPVRISLLHELNNYRIFLIRDGDQARFDQVKSVNDLRKLTAGLGSQWPDADVMRNDDFNVVTSPTYSSLFKMLVAKRFDYFPRGLYEVWDEAARYKDQGLVVEKKLMLYYQAPFYFFVNKKNTALADRIERGLNIALADGSFDELFLSVPSYKRGMEEQKNSQRILFPLH
jgi:ABC-type amino acid transport substrate-binding protein